MSAPGDSETASQNANESPRQPTDPALHPDFDALVAKAFAVPDAPAPDSDSDAAETTEAPPISIEDLDALWAAFFKLEEWVFLVQPVPGRDPFPFIGRYEERLWFFLFTDHERLRRFADAGGLLDPELNAHFITMSPEQSLEWLGRLHAVQQSQAEQPEANAPQNASTAVTGIRVNEGPHGWYAPLESLSAIYGHLKELERI